MEPDKARAIAEELKVLFEPSCHRIEIAVGIRRLKPDAGARINRRIAMVAIQEGWHLRAYGRDFAAPQGSWCAARSEGCLSLWDFRIYRRRRGSDGKGFAIQLFH